MEMLKYEFKLVSSLITEAESQNVHLILRVLKHQFYRYLEDSLEDSIEPGHIRDLIEDNFKLLQKNTDRNVIVLLWLGIIDIRKLIRFMITDEEKKAQIKGLDS